MHFNIKSLLAVGLLTANLLYAGPRIQTGNEQQKDQKVIVSSVEVPVDVIVRDKAGRPVKGLSAADFEVYENGVLQPITSVRLVTHDLAEAEATATKTADPSKPAIQSQTPGNGLTETTTTALVFDSLAPEARLRSRDAALNYVSENMKADSRMGVFVTGLVLDVLQPWTQDTQRVKAAVERTANINAPGYASSIQEARTLREELADRQQGFDPHAEPLGDKFAVDRLRMKLSLLEKFEVLEREQQGHATINGLTVIVNSLRTTPGRKAVIFFSEGIPLPSTVEPFMRALISAANAANVSIYAIDAAGLRVVSAQTTTKREIESNTNLRMTELGAGADRNGPMTKDFERNEDLLRLDPRSGLGQLSDQTGGFLIQNTNDFKDRMNRIGEELRTYYALSYAPKDQTEDGQFRRIEVKVKRSGVTVQARKGYYAIHTSFDSPLLEYETPALAALASGRGPKDLAIRASAMSFPEPRRTGLVTALADIPMQAIAFRTDEKTKTFSTDFSVVVTFKSAASSLVTKMSHHYLMSGPAANLAALQKENIQFYREGDLAPGRYQMQTAVYDAFAKKAGVQEATIEVPAASDNDLRLSDIVFIKRTERLSAEEQKNFNPFHVGELLAYPNLGEAVSKAKNKQLSFFFTAYVPKGSSAAPKLMLELSQQGQTLAQLPADLPAADAAGRIRFAGGLPLEVIPPGAYDLKVIVTSGGKSVARAAHLVIE
ncbi:MAG TPA: VWA domain-containing protein [Blastocatellia bacterium]|nr:VWA domain-containing protein [Blastocatellia bacterium]